MKGRIAVGMSGGVDSLVTALLLQKQGFEVIGVHLSLQEEEQEDESLDALCRQAGIPLYRIKGQELFHEKVITPFIKDYMSGLTPNPCAICNSFIKWELLAQAAEQSGITTIATGHYTRILAHEGRCYVHKGIDPIKEQSYFLWGVPERILQRAITPLGDYTKAEVKEMARQWGFDKIAAKRENMGICFLKGKNYRDFILQQNPETNCLPGPIIDTQGNLIGQHEGLLHYTIGQKQGIPPIDGRPQYVKHILPKENTLVIAAKENLQNCLLVIGNTNFINQQELSAPDIEVKIRGLGLNPEGFARITQADEDKYLVHLSSPAWAAAPGQPVVFYRGDRVIGGGILHETQD